MKKGILLPETLKIIIAVVCLILLIYLAVSLYGIFTQNHRLEQAKVNIDDISRIMSGLKDGESKEYVLLSPYGWVLTGWPYKPTFGDNMIPNVCSNNGWKNCICFCPYADTLAQALVNARAKDILNKCNSGGICKEASGPGLVVSSRADLDKYPIVVNAVVKSGKPLNISLNGGIYSVRTET